VTASTPPTGDRVLQYIDLADEVARLRAALHPLVERTPLAYDRAEDPYCAYCAGDLSRGGSGHHTDCPWVAARAVLSDPFPAPKEEQR
jgi:hypothetical protein